MQQPLVIGIDGGGTKTTACLAELRANGPAVLARATTGPSNLVADGEELALRNLQAAVDQAFAKSEMDAKCVSSICLALAGSDRRDVQRRVRHWAVNRGIADQVSVVNDAEPLLTEFDVDINRAALICGTGSFAYGRSLDGRTARAGGWGPVIGDEGSGYWLGVELLRAVSMVFDQRDQKSNLTERAIRSLQLTEPCDLPRLVAERGRPFVASLSSLVEDAAAEGDDLAVAICQSAAQSLHQLVKSVTSQLGFVSQQFDLILGGGVLLHRSAVSRLFDQMWTKSKLEPRRIHRSNDAALGAVRLACQKICE